MISINENMPQEDLLDIALDEAGEDIKARRKLQGHSFFKLT